jgi:DNA-binding NtrC family response regulator
MQVQRILVIDDDASSRGTIREALELDGFEVTEASNGRIGISLFQHRPTDLVLCDIFMPEKDGLETIIDLKREYPGVRIVTMNDNPFGDMDYTPVALRLGATRVLKKPLGLDLLLDTVHEVLDEA